MFYEKALQIFCCDKNGALSKKMVIEKKIKIKIVMVTKKK
jgi:hypothetical protein